MKKLKSVLRFGKFLRNRRKQANLTQADVSRTLGYSTPQFVSNVECGKCEMPFDALRVICGMYGISKVEMFNELMNIENERITKGLKC